MAHKTFLFSSELSGHVIKSSVVFNSLEKSSSAVESEEDSELKGPVVSLCGLAGRFKTNVRSLFRTKNKALDSGLDSAA